MEIKHKRKVLSVLSISILLIVITLNYGWNSGTIITANVTYVGERNSVKGIPFSIPIKALTNNYIEVSLTMPPYIKVKAGDNIEILEKGKLFSNDKSYAYHNPEGKGLTRHSSGTANSMRPLN